MEIYLQCPECGADMVLRETKKFTYKDGKPRKFWGCSRWPECNGIHGAHPDGKPLGIPASKAVKDERSRLHRICEKVFADGKDWKQMKKIEKEIMYNWLEKNFGEKEGHIAMMGMAELKSLEWLLKYEFADKFKNGK